MIKMIKINRQIVFSIVAASMGLSGCATSTAVHAPRNYTDDTGGHAIEERRAIDSKFNEKIDLARELNRSRCSAPLLPQSHIAALSTSMDEILSIGDILKIEIQEGEEFSGLVEIAMDGSINLPLLTPIKTHGKTLGALENIIAHQLVKNGYFQRGFAVVSASIVQTGARRVSVSGAVFQPGVFLVNERKREDLSANEQQAYGDATPHASVATALRRAAGIRPDADIANIVLIRNTERRVLDMSGAFSGNPIENPTLVSGDQIIVPSRGCFQEDLSRASAVTAPGIRLYISNLTQPSSGSFQKSAADFPYGTRLLQAAVSTNCVGGIHLTNANRYVVYITKDWISGRTVVIERPVEALVRRADRDNFNPFLQEGDALACYDSAVTNVRDIIGLIGEIASPLIITRALIGG